MSTYSQAVWRQLKSKTIQEIKRALERDGWIEEPASGATAAFRHPSRTDPEHNRVVLHIHPKKTMGQSLLKGLFDTMDWSVDDLVRLRLVRLNKKELENLRATDVEGR